MSFLDRLFGRAPSVTSTRRTSDAVAVERYHFLLRTAPPEQLEQAHLEAFERLTPEQREMVRGELATVDPAEAPLSAQPADLARSATRAELRQPGTLERTFQAQGAGPGVGGSFLQTFAMVFVATSAAQLLFSGMGSPLMDAGMDTSGPGDETGGSDAGGWDAGGDFGDF